MLGVLIVAGALFASYYADTGGSMASLQSQVSSLSEASVSLGSVVASQSHEMQSLATSGVQTMTVISTTTLTLTGGGGTGSTTTVVSTTTVTKSTVVTATVTTGGANVVNVMGSLQPDTGVNVTGLVTVSVMNDGYDPVTGIAVTIPTGPDPSSDLCTSSCPLQMTYQSVAVSSAAPLPGGATASGSAQTSESQPNTSYTITVVVTFGDGSVQTLALQVSD